MGAVWQLSASELRRRWRSVVVLMLLVGAIGAVVLATVAGARRTTTALARFNSSTAAATVQMQVGSATPAQLRAFAKVPEVKDFGVVAAFAVMDPSAPNLTIVAEPNTQVGTEIDRARVLAGRAANPAAVDEVAIDESVVAQIHRGLGDVINLVSYSPAQMTAVMNNQKVGKPNGPQVHLRVVGIIRRPFDLGRRGQTGGITILTPAFYRAYANRIGKYPVWSVRVRTRNGLPDIPQIKTAALRIFGPSPFFQVTNPKTESGGAQDAIDVLTIALWILAAVAGAAGAVAIGIVLTRETSLPAFDQETLRALGLTKSQRSAIAAPQAALVAVGGALIAAVSATGASGLFPIGIARVAEVDPGIRIDWPVMILGIIAIGLVVFAIQVVAAVRNTRTGPPEHDSRISRRTADAAAAAGLAPVFTNGLRMAMERGRGRSAVPVRSAFIGAILGIFGVTAVLVFASSLNHIVESPRRFGWMADFSAPENTTVSANSCIRNDYGLLEEPGVGAVASVCEQSDNIALDGHQVSGWSLTSLRGTIEPTVVAGRAPDGPEDVALGATTLQTLGKHIGNSVVGAGPHGKRQYRIVGEVLFPSLGQIQPLADGALFTGPGFAPIFDTNNYSRYLLGRFTPNADRSAVEHWIATNHNLSPATIPSVPVEIERIHQVDWLPTTLAILFAVLASIAVGYALVTSVHRRRRELAVFKTLGFKRRQVRATISWQAMTVAIVGLLIGLPAGLITGRVIWRRVANNLGIASAATIPTLALALLIPAAIVIVNLIAFAPARTAAHTQPGVILRSE